MFGFLREPPKPDDSARETLDRAIALLRQYKRHGIPAADVGEVLEMLGAAPETAPAPKVPAPDPGTDPLTGCHSALPG